MATVLECVFHPVRMLELNEPVLQCVFHTVKMLELNEPVQQNKLKLL